METANMSHEEKMFRDIATRYTKITRQVEDDKKKQPVRTFLRKIDHAITGL